MSPTIGLPPPDPEICLVTSRVSRFKGGPSSTKTFVTSWCMPAASATRMGTGRRRVRGAGMAGSMFTATRGDRVATHACRP